MIQRIQTLFLGLALISMALMFYFPMLKFIGSDEQNPDIFFTILGLKSEADLSGVSSYNVIILIIVSIVIFLLFFAISRFKNRVLQMNLCRLTMFLLMGIIAALFIIINGLLGQLSAEGYVEGYGIGYFLPIVALVFTALALHYIGKDEKLIKSLDRIR